MQEITKYIKERIDKLGQARGFITSLNDASGEENFTVVHIDTAIEELQAVLSKLQELNK